MAPNTKKKPGEPTRPIPPQLKPWRPGQSGNPSGRPKRLPITEALREVLGTQVEGDKKGRTYERLLADVLVSMAISGGPRKLEALREVLDRVEGKSVQRSEFSGPEGGPLQFETPGSREEAEKRIAEILSGARRRKKSEGEKP